VGISLVRKMCQHGELNGQLDLESVAGPIGGRRKHAIAADLTHGWETPEQLPNPARKQEALRRITVVSHRSGSLFDRRWAGAGLVFGIPVAARSAC